MGAGQGNPEAPAGRPADVPEGDEMDESGEIAPPALVRAPGGPSRAEVAEHEATGHVQYRSWCRHCLAGRGLGQQHRARPDEEKASDELATISRDYTWMTRDGKEDGKTKPILVIRDSRTLAVAATFVDAKGPTPYAVKFMANFIKHLGYRRAVFKSDGEHAIVALKEQAAKEAGVENVPQESPVADHRANGAIENLCRELKRQVRVLRSSLEEKLGRILKDDDPVLSWFPRHAADLMCRYKRGSDGKTPEQRRCGREWRKPAIAIGERLYYREVGEGARPLKEGRYIGHQGRTGTLLVVTSEGVKRGTGVRRLPEEDQWNPQGWESLKGYPWEVSVRAPGTPGQRAPGTPAQGVEDLLVSEDRVEVPPQVVPVMAPPQQRRIYIRKVDVEKYQPTDGCPGCTCVLLGESTQLPHTEMCRARIVGLMMDDEQGRRRVEAHKRKKEESAEVGVEADLPAQEAMGEPAAEAGVGFRQDPGQAIEYVDDPAKRAELKRAAADPPASSSPKSKAKPTTQTKRPGALYIAPGAKQKTQQKQGEKREPAVSPEELRTETQPAADAETSNTPDKPPDVGGLELGRLKRMLRSMVGRKVERAFLAQEVEISAVELEQITKLCVEMGAVDIMEIYSPKRFTAQAGQYGLRPGFAVDLEEQKPDGSYWDLSKAEDVRELEEYVDEVEPTLLTGSPPCDQFSQLQNINKYRVSPDKRREKMDRAVAHLNTACRFYRKQLQAGRFFLHEAPWSATSWKDPEVRELTERPDVYTVRGPMCRWAMVATDRRGLQGTGYVRKETGWMTNHPGLAQLLEGECTNNVPGKPWHRHIHLIGGLARPAARYPPALVRAVLKTLKSHLVESGQLSALDAAVAGPIPEENFVTPEDVEQYWDDVNGGFLPPDRVREARQIELDYLRKQEVYEKVPLEECLRETNGKGPITTRWIDTNKGDPANPNFRSRLVVREIKARKSPEERIPQNMLFSSTPPLEAMRLLCSLWATERVSHRGRPLKIGLWDISRAHFYGVPKRRIYIQLPDEDASPGMVGRLTKSMYGTQDAPNIWQQHYTQLLIKAGYLRGKSNGSVFYHPTLGVRVLVHGDDFMALGDAEALKEVDALLRSAYELKWLGTVGDEEGDHKEVHFLNRLIRCDQHQGASAILIEPDRRHVDLLVQQLGMDNAKGAETPDVKKSVELQMQEARSPALPKEQASLYRSCVMRAAYLSQDRLDISHAVKNLARKMVSPTEASLQDLKRLCRYLIKKPDVCQVFARQAKPSKLRIQVDSDHAGDAMTRRSTTGMVALYGLHVLKHSSNVQSTIALSTGESEYYALVKGGSVGLGSWRTSRSRPRC